MAPKARNHRRRRRTGHPAAAALLMAFIADAIAKIVLAVLEYLLHLSHRGLP